LGALCYGLDFRIVSKIPPVPDDLDDSEAARWALASAQSSRGRLGSKLDALLFHRAEDLQGARGEIVWNAVAGWAESEHIVMGASAYDVESVVSLYGSRRIGIAQMPGNAFDQRLRSMNGDATPGMSLHLRSAFLQGLLLLPTEVGSARVPPAARALQKWRQWLGARSLSPLRGALAIVKGFENVGTCVIGVDNINQLSEITEIWGGVEPMGADELACEDPAIIDPRQWDDLGQ
jgi:aryl-alcohol dehydrogenase-like predicted oxidoreductase